MCVKFSILPTLLLLLSNPSVSTSFTFLHTAPSTTITTTTTLSLSTNDDDDNINDKLGQLLTSRFPTSVEDQVRQASAALQRAMTDGQRRHTIRLLLPLIGATELDDWPGGARQQMEAASPLVQDIWRQPTTMDDEDNKNDTLDIQETVLDDNDGVRALYCFRTDAKDDSVSVLLPSADTMDQLLALDRQVGPTRNMCVVNPQWRRTSDFSFLNRKSKVEFATSFAPTFVCTSSMVEGDQIRILRTYPNPWKVYLRRVQEGTGEIEWVCIGTKEISLDDTNTSSNAVSDFGQPSYQEITDMITSQEGYVPKSLAERAASAFTFIKDTL